MRPRRPALHWTARSRSPSGPDAEIYAALGAHEKTIMKIGGWKTRSVFDRYNVVDAKELLLLDLIAKRSSESCRTVVAQ